MSSAPSAIDVAVASEAADWLLRMQAEELGADDWEALQAWRARSAMHEAAWNRAQAVIGMVRQVPAPFGHATMNRLNKLSRRRVVQQMLGLLMLAAPVVWVVPKLPAWRADLRTARGERKNVELPDGTRLVLNTSSAVDVVFSATERNLRLYEGEILVTTHRDPRPFRVDTAHGNIVPLGTRFSVRRLDEQTQVAVFEHAVQVVPRQAAPSVLQAGEQLVFSASQSQAIAAVRESAAAWERGLFVANRVRLTELVAELGRYRSGVIRCHAGVADMLVSGTFPIDNDDAALAMLEQALPLRINRQSRYWLTIEAR